MAEESSEYSESVGDGIGRFGEMSMNAQIAEAASISGIVESTNELPAPSEEVCQRGRVYQLLAFQPPYVIGRFYKCQLSDGIYVWKDVSAVEVETVEDEATDRFSLEGNTLTLSWIDREVEGRAFIKTEIQLVHKTSGSARTIFTESTASKYSGSSVDVIIDSYTASDLSNGILGVRAVTTHVGKTYIRNLTEVAM